MKIIVTHKACDLDAVVSAWLIKRFLPGWENANLQFVPAGEKLEGQYAKTGEEIEEIILPNGDRAEIIHVDTGLGKLDHHQTENTNVCATSLSFDYVKKHNESLMRDENKLEALRRIVEYVIDDDHFQEVFYENPTADLYDFSIIGLIHGIKLRFPKDDLACINFGMEMIEAVFHYFENKIWAEEEIKEKGIDFMTRWGKGIAIETLNDTVLKLAQTMGFVLAVRKDPATGSVRIKARPKKRNVILNEREGSLVGRLRGQIGSRGSVTGKARVIRAADIAGADIGVGDILVTDMTTPDFLPLMMKTGGVVTAWGGILSHAAIVCRELNIPCVVGVQNATTILHTGDKVEIDLESGSIRKIIN